MKKYLYIGLLALAATSCSDNFLKEEMVSTITQDYFLTEQGLDQLVVTTYNAQRLRHQYSEGFFSFEVGHDASAVHGRLAENSYSTSTWNTTGNWNTIPGFMNSFMGAYSAGTTIYAYPVIDCCNKAIGSIRGGTAVGKYASDDSYAAQRLSEALFNRAYLLYSLNTLLGDIYVPTVSITSLPANFAYTRMSSEDLYKLIIGDLRYAVDNLPESYSDAEFGRATKYTAAHLLAKLYLCRARGAEFSGSSYGRNSDGSIDNSNPQSYLGMLYKGSGSNDLDSCIYYTSMIINSGKYELEADYLGLFKNGIGTYEPEYSKENIMVALFANGGDNYRYGNRACAFFAGDYVNNKWGIPDYCWEYPSAPNTGFRTNDWGFDVFTDKINDARFQKSFNIEFKTAINSGTRSSQGANIDYYAYNDANNTTYTWTEAQAAYFNQNILPTYKRESWGGRQAVAGEHKMGAGDLAFAYLENTKATAIDVAEADAQPFVLFARWMKKDGKYFYRPQIVEAGGQYSFVAQLGEGTSTNHYGLENSMRQYYPASLKYDDCNRLGANSAYASKDQPVFRLPETYLMRAEAYGRKGNYSAAIEDINVLRKRASYKAGESRAEVIARLYPGHENLSTAEQQWPYAVEGDTYDKIKVDATYWDGASEKSQLENYPPAATTNEKRFIEFILNEYLREFAQEMVYVEHVHHSGLQAERIQWHAQLGANPNNTSYQVGSWDSSDNTTATTGQTGQPKGAFQNYMTLKPFPQTFVDMLTDEDGNLLDDTAKNAYQNYGYNQ